MKFWDTSAIVSLCVAEPTTAAVRSILDKDPSIAVWWATRTECVSAFARQARDGLLKAAGERHARLILDALAQSWTEMLPSDALREAAERLLAIHPLRAADAFQLAAALRWCQGQTKGAVTVSFDARLREVAVKEGFTLLPRDL